MLAGPMPPTGSPSSVWTVRVPSSHSSPSAATGSSGVRMSNETRSFAFQVDFADVPRMPAFPRSGLFSLFVSEDLTRAKVLYFPRIIRDVSKLWSDFSRVPDVGDVPGPYARPVKLTFERREGCVPMRDYRFDEIVGRDFAAALPASPDFDSIHDRIWRWSGADDSRIGGYASPGQDDPRARKARRGLDVTLLELQNDNFTLDLFIESARLRRRDFSHVFYHSACD